MDEGMNMPAPKKGGDERRKNKVKKGPFKRVCNQSYLTDLS